MKFRLNRTVHFILVITLLTCTIFPASSVLAKSQPEAGIDISENNGKIDWALVKEQEIKFAMIKTGNGKDSGNTALDLDSRFEENYQNAGEYSINRGVYHVCCSKTVADAKKEADFCLSILKGRPLEYPVAYDIEMEGTFRTGKKNVTAMAEAFCDKIKKAGYTPMIYSSSHALNTYFDYQAVKKYKIWVAHYGASPSFNHPYFIWQYTNKGDVNGANTDQGCCDLNYSYESIPADRISLNKKSLVLGAGESFTLSAAMTPLSTTDKISWSSSAPSVVSVASSGKISAKKAGTAVIKAMSGSGKYASCKVTVKKSPAFVKFLKYPKKMKAGKTFKISPVLSKKAACNHYKYSSSNSSILSVDKNGKLTAKKKGSAVIKVTTYNKKSAAVRISVY